MFERASVRKLQRRTGCPDNVAELGSIAMFAATSGPLVSKQEYKLLTKLGRQFARSANSCKDPAALLDQARCAVKGHYHIAEMFSDSASANRFHAAVVKSIQPREDLDRLVSWFEDPEAVEPSGYALFPREQEDGT